MLNTISPLFKQIQHARYFPLSKQIQVPRYFPFVTELALEFFPNDSELISACDVCDVSQLYDIDYRDRDCRYINQEKFDLHKIAEDIVEVSLVIGGSIMCRISGAGLKILNVEQFETKNDSGANAASRSNGSNATSRANFTSRITFPFLRHSPLFMTNLKYATVEVVITSKTNAWSRMKSFRSVEIGSRPNVHRTLLSVLHVSDLSNIVWKYLRLPFSPTSSLSSSNLAPETRSAVLKTRPANIVPWMSTQYHEALATEEYKHVREAPILYNLIDQFQDINKSAVMWNTNECFVYFDLQHIITKLYVEIVDQEIVDYISSLTLEILDCGVYEHGDTLRCSLRRFNNQNIFRALFSDNTQIDDCVDWSTVKTRKTRLRIQTSKVINKTFDLYILARNLNIQVTEHGISYAMFRHATTI